MRTLGDRLDSIRRKLFVGRVKERALLAAALDGDAGNGFVFFVHGVGGIGKSALLETFADDARSAGRRVIKVDCRFIDAEQSAFLDAVGPISDGCVLIVDTFERCQGLEMWLSRKYLTQLPADTVVVIASRHAPSISWWSDPAWFGALRVLRLTDLDPSDSARLISDRGIPAELCTRLLAFAGGHPLALNLAAEVARHETSNGGTWEAGPDVVGTLLTQLVGETPTEWHRRALALCAHVEASTEETLRTVVPADQASVIFTWLRDQPYIETSPRGIFPHDVVRDALEADMRWRDPQTYLELHRAVQPHLLQKLRTAAGADALRSTRDFLYIFRHNPIISSFYSSWGSVDLFGSPYRPDDRTALLKFAERAEGANFAAVVEYWLDRAPEAFQVCRRISTEEPVGFSAWLRLSEPDAQDRAADSVVDRAWTHVERTAPLRPGEYLGITRFMVDPERYGHRSPALDLMIFHGKRPWLSGDGLAWSFCVAAYPDEWADRMAGLQHYQISDAPQVGGVPSGLFACDWRRTPPEPWLEWLSGQSLPGRAIESTPPEPSAPVLLGRADFDDAVRFALRALHSESLSRSVLLHTRLIGADDQLDRRRALKERIVEAIRVMATDPRETKAWRALDTTYVRRTPTHEAAARRLGLPSTTYKRHLARGIRLLSDRLWENELGGGQG